jgi:hypothetical protein
MTNAGLAGLSNMNFPHIRSGAAVMGLEGALCKREAVVLMEAKNLLERDDTHDTP